MYSDKRFLFDFLRDGHPGGRDGVDARLEVLDPFFRKAEDGEYRLSPAGSVEAQAAADAISVAAGVGVKRVSFVSLSRGASPLTGEARTAFWQAHAKDLTDDLKGALWRQHSVVLGTTLSPTRRTRLERVIWRAVGEPLWHSFEQNRWDETGNDLRLVIRANVLTAFLHYAGFVLLGNQRRLDALRPLMELMSGTLPVGERADAPGTWTCVVA